MEMEDGRRESTRRLKDEILQWSSPTLLLICGFFLMKVFGAIDATTSAVNAQAITLAQMQVMINNNNASMTMVATSLDRIREQQLELSQRLTRVESRIH